MLAEPRWFYDDSAPALKTFVIPLIRLDAVEDLSQTGISTVQMKIEEVNSTELGYQVEQSWSPTMQILKTITAMPGRIILLIHFR